MAEEIIANKEVIQTPSSLPKKSINVWMIASVIIVIALLAVIVWPKQGNITGALISEDDAGKNAVDFINKNLVSSGKANLSSVQDLGSLYEVNTTYNGKTISVYITKDGKYFIQSITDINNLPPKAAAQTAATAVNVTKSEKPKADAFVFSYCPYGLQFEKALSPVYNLLKDSADINIVFIGAMHGEYEKTESLRQLCVLKEYGKDKLFAYLDKFNANTTIGNCKGDDACLSPLLESLMKSISIDKSKIDSCMTTDAQSLYDVDVAKAKSLGISGSPTFLINGAKVQLNRSPDAVKKAICDAFTKAPAACNQTLSSTAASVGFGSAAAAASSGGGCGSA